MALWIYCQDVVPLDLAERCVEELYPFVLFNHVGAGGSISDGQPLFVFCNDAKSRYKYFKDYINGVPFPKSLTELKLLAEELVQKELKEEWHFDSAFINLYRSGKDSIPPHRDTTHGKAAPIVGKV